LAHLVGEVADLLAERAHFLSLLAHLVAELAHTLAAVGIGRAPRGEARLLLAETRLLATVRRLLPPQLRLTASQRRLLPAELSLRLEKSLDVVERATVDDNVAFAVELVPEKMAAVAVAQRVLIDVGLGVTAHVIAVGEDVIAVHAAERRERREWRQRRQRLGRCRWRGRCGRDRGDLSEQHDDNQCQHAVWTPSGDRS